MWIVIHRIFELGLIMKARDCMKWGGGYIIVFKVSELRFCTGFLSWLLASEVLIKGFGVIMMMMMS